MSTIVLFGRASALAATRRELLYRSACRKRALVRLYILCNYVIMDNEHGRRGLGPRGRGPRGRRGPMWRLAEERRGRSSTTQAEREEIRAWFIGNLVDNWFVAEPELAIDDYEILVVGMLPAVELKAQAASDQDVADAARIERFRVDTRDRRIEIALAGEERFSRKVSWGVTVGSTTKLFTTASVPVMTRLQLQQRQTLDTLVDAGVARSRSEALAWCVELVGRNEDEWINRLRSALEDVARARADGPS